MGRPRKVVEATAVSPLIRALQSAYNSAGKPELNALAKEARVSYGALRLTIRGTAPKPVELIERTLAALGYEVQLKYIGKPSSDAARPAQG